MLKNPITGNTFKPSQWRLMLFRVLLMVAAYQVAILLYHLLLDEFAGAFTFRETWLAYSLPFISVYTVSMVLTTRAHINDLSVKVANGFVEGPTGNRWKRTRFSVEKVDLAKTRCTNMWNSLLLYRYIWSLDGSRIVVYTHAFRQDQLDDLFQQLGC